MSRLTQRQRVKVNAALTYIHSQGFHAQAVVDWASEYRRSGHEPRQAYQKALNEFLAGQPALAKPIGNLVRLVEASDIPTVAKYDLALSAYIETGDDNALADIAPIMARDSMTLAIRHGEVEAGEVNAARVEAATGFALADEVVTAAAIPQPAKSHFAFNHQTRDGPLNVHVQQAASAQVSPYPDRGRVADKAAARIAAQGPPPVQQGSQTLLQGHVIGDGGSAN